MLINDVECITTNYSIRWTELIVHSSSSYKSRYILKISKM